MDLRCRVGCKRVLAQLNLFRYRSAGLGGAGAWPVRGLRPSRRDAAEIFQSFSPKENDMIRFYYYHPTPNPAKVALFLVETGLAYQVVPVDTSKGEQRLAGLSAINPNGKVPGIVDTEGPGGREVRVFDSSAILLYLGDKTKRLIGPPADQPGAALLAVVHRLGSRPLLGSSGAFPACRPGKASYAINRYRREVERHYRVLDEHLAPDAFVVGDEVSIVDISVWGWFG